VEGTQPPTLAHDPEDNTLQITKNLTCRNSKHRKPKPFQIAIPPAVPLLRRGTVMGIAVHFDPEPYF